MLDRELLQPRGYMELLWPVATDDDEACSFAREKIVEIARPLSRG